MFQLLLNMVHFANNKNNPQNDRFHKIQSLVDKVVYNFQTVLDPGETVCIDESLIPFRGRLVMRQYLKGKRHKYGIKMFKLCCNEDYTHNIQIYAGKNLDQHQTTPSRVVMKLAEPLLDYGRTMVTDNWYTSLSLAEQLLDIINLMDYVSLAKRRSVKVSTVLEYNKICAKCKVHIYECPQTIFICWVDR